METMYTHVRAFRALNKQETLGRIMALGHGASRTHRAGAQRVNSRREG